MTALPKTLTDEQAMFDAAYIGCAGQGWRRSVSSSEYEPESCMYRGEDGMKCAIGHCIPDELYDVKFEGRAAYGLPFDFDDRGFECELQECHDSSNGDMKQRFDDFAKRHGLSIPDVSAIEVAS